jgi:hypothetical protein
MDEQLPKFKNQKHFQKFAMQIIGVEIKYANNQYHELNVAAVLIITNS